MKLQSSRSEVWEYTKVTAFYFVDMGRDSDIAMASKINMEAICDVL
jgi:hypothetical protein